MQATVSVTEGRARGVARDVTLTGCRAAVKQILDIANFGKLFSID